MAFTTQTFIFVFFPVCMLLYFFVIFLQSKGIAAALLTKCRAADLFLIAISSAFYCCTCFDDVFRFAGYILLLFLMGHIIQLLQGRNYHLILEDPDREQKRLLLPISIFFLFFAVFVLLCILILFKYTDLLTAVWNSFFKTTLKTTPPLVQF